MRLLSRRWSALAVAFLWSVCAAAEPTIIAPKEPVPIGAFCDVTITNMDLPQSLRWDTVPQETVRVTAAWGTTDPVLSLPTHKNRRVALILMWKDSAEGEIQHRQIALVIGTGPPVVIPTPVDPVVPVDPVPTIKVTAATYVYEKDDHAVPNYVLAALNKLNRGLPATVDLPARPPINANLLEADTTDGTGDVPEQYKAALAEAKRVGLPCLVVTGPGGVVIRTVKNPTTEAAVMEAAK